MKKQIVQTTMCMSDETRKRLKYYAIQKNTSVSKLVSDWIWSVEVDVPDDCGGNKNAKSPQS